MENFELDPEFFLPPGHNIIDGGPDRLPRTYTMPAVPITRRHERFVIADVHPAPPADNVIQVRQEVAAFLLHRGLHVRSAQPWIEGVGLFELRDAAESYAAVHMVPQEVAHNSVVRFLRHDQGLGFCGQEGFRQGCLMILGVPLDFRNTEDLRAAMNTFGEFHHWVSDDPYLVRSIVFASFPDDRLVPRSINFSEYAAWGGAKVSWSAPVYILGAAAAEILPNDEDPMPLNGNPHPLPGHLVHDNLQFALPSYPALGWNAVPLAPEDPVVPAADAGGWGQPPAAADGGGWEPEAAPEAPAAGPVQDQESMPQGDMEVEPADQEPPLANPDAPDADMPLASQGHDAEPEEDKGTRKKATPVVDSSVRRCTRGSIKRDGFKPILQELPAHVPKKRKPKAKPMPSTLQETEDVQVPPATPILVIQEVGQSLGIAPKQLTVDRLMEDPADSAPSSTDV
uniref:DUF7597 domain-containing protein n=1 Tax=Hordeum vulgare subsp. vulgare TaxID=112509 RepID=A0A8I6WVX7_HORVV